MSSKYQNLLSDNHCSSMLMPWTLVQQLRGHVRGFSSCTWPRIPLDHKHRNCTPCYRSNDIGHRQCYRFLRVYQQVHIERMPAGQCQVSNKCNQLTTFCLRNNYTANPRTAPDLSLRLQRAFWGMSLQIVLDSCDSLMQMKLPESFWPKQVSHLSLWSIEKCDCQKIMTCLLMSFDWIQRGK